MRTTLGLALVALTATGCASGASNFSPAATSATTQSVMMQAHAANPGDAPLFVISTAATSPHINTLTVYADAQTGFPKPWYTVNYTKPNRLYHVVVDKDEDVYLVQQHITDSTIGVYSAWGHSLLRTYAYPGYYNAPLGFDRAGNFYMSSSNASFDAQVLVFAPGSTTPSETLDLGTHYAATAVSPSGAIFASNDYFSAHYTPFRVYLPHQTTYAYTFTIPGVLPKVVFGTSGNAFVLVNDGTSSRNGIYVYAPGSAKPSYIISNGIDLPGDEVIDNASNLYVSNNVAGTISVYRAGATSPAYTIAEPSGSGIALQLLIDPWGNVFAAYTMSSGGVSQVYKFQAQTGTIMGSIPVNIPAMGMSSSL